MFYTASDAQWHRRACQCFCRCEKYRSGNGKSTINDTGDVGPLKQSSHEKAGKALYSARTVPFLSLRQLCLVLL